MLDVVTFHAYQADAPGRTPGVRWVAELVDGSGMATVPLCVAWLSDMRPALGFCLDCLCVPLPENRRLGYATRTVRECLARWPDLWLTDPVTAEGAAFLDSLDEGEGS